MIKLLNWNIKSQLEHPNIYPNTGLYSIVLNFHLKEKSLIMKKYVISKEFYRCFNLGSML